MLVPSARRTVDAVTAPLARATGRWFDHRYVAGRHYACHDETGDEARRSTALDRRTGFDWLLFQLMLSDEARLAAYGRDIALLAAGARVLEVGPGPEAVLTRRCLDAGAASIVSVEGDPWVARRARSRLDRERRHAGRWRVVSRLSTELSASDVDGDRHFDLLVLEVYDTIASREHVVETVGDLRRRGFSFDAVVSCGFETLVAPAAAPPAKPMRWGERVLLGWGPGSPARAATALRQRRSTLHGDFDLVDGLRLAPARRWQAADLEADATATTARVLEFQVAEPERYAGFLVHNRLRFHHGVLDTGETPTHWGVYFVPLPVPVAAVTAAGGVTLYTVGASPAEPSSFTLEAVAGDARSPHSGSDQGSGWHHPSV